MSTVFKSVVLRLRVLSICEASSSLFNPRVNKRASAPFELVHSDVWGPCPVMSPTRFRYFVTFVDDYSRTTWLSLIKNRYELFSHFRAFYAKIHTQFHVSIQSLRSDNAKECLKTVLVIHASK